MTRYAIAANARLAAAGDAPRARSAADAEAAAGGPVAFVVETLPEPFETAEAAHAAAPELFADGGEVVFLDGAYRIVMRYWRPLPPLPVAAGPKEALRSPLGFARTETEAQATAGAPVEAAAGALPARYASIPAARRKWGQLIDAGLADIDAKGDRFVVVLRYWRPLPPEVAMQDLAARLAAPLKARIPQAPMDIGLFEGRDPANPDVVLVAEEGSGRKQQE